MIIAQNQQHLEQLIEEAIEKDGPYCDLNFIDVSRVSTMKYLFSRYPEFNGDISKWNVSKVIDMSHMFECSQFDGDISRWDVSNVADMSYMFSEAAFNGDISRWNVTYVENMSWMFRNSPF